MILYGPGRLGPWPENEADYWHQEPNQAPIIRAFYGIPVGDVVVLRVGLSQAYGLGIVTGEPLWSDEFGDVDGWDIQHVRRVHWLWRCHPGQPYQFTADEFNFGRSVQRLRSPEVLRWMEGLNLPFAEPVPDPEPLPGVRGPEFVTDIGIEKISDFLFDKGLATAAIDALTSQIDDLVRLSRWYQSRTINPSEQETIVHLIAPLLKALAWTAQRIAFQFNYADLALFRDMPREPQNLVMLIEAKRWQRPCLTAQDQVRGYAQQWESCRRIIATDGVRYAVWVRNNDGFASKPNAYLNLARMVEDYPVLGYAGALEALYLMSRDWAG